MTISEVAQGFTSADADDDRWVDPRLVRAAAGAAARGTVLLTNDGVLPLAPQTRVAVFGRVQIDWFAVGYGSGGDVNAPYTTNLLDSLVEAGVAVDAELARTYRDWCAAQAVPTPQWGDWPRFHPEMELDDETVEAAATRAEIAVVVIGRAAGEDRENVLEPGSYYLTETERRLLEQVTSRFERTIVVVDSGNVMDLSWAEGPGVSALLLAWPGGMEGARAVAEVLRGAVEPGGRLTDTIARRYEDYPSAANFGDPDANDYAEDVFVGYRYFETFAPQAVQFPFGHGLGYTTFTVAPGGAVRDGGAVRLGATVANTGARAGSTVVQVYAGAVPRAGGSRRPRASSSPSPAPRSSPPERPRSWTSPSRSTVSPPSTTPESPVIATPGCWRRASTRSTWDCPSGRPQPRAPSPSRPSRSSNSSRRRSPHHPITPSSAWSRSAVRTGAPPSAGSPSPRPPSTCASASSRACPSRSGAPRALGTPSRPGGTASPSRTWPPARRIWTPSSPA